MYAVVRKEYDYVLTEDDRVKREVVKRSIEKVYEDHFDADFDRRYKYPEDTDTVKHLVVEIEMEAE